MMYAVTAKRTEGCSNVDWHLAQVSALSFMVCFGWWTPLH